HYSEATAKLIDEEMKRIVEECFAEADRLLTANRDRLDRLATALLERDSLDEKEILEVTGLQPAIAAAGGGGRSARAPSRPRSTATPRPLPTRSAAPSWSA